MDFFFFFLPYTSFATLPFFPPLSFTWNIFFQLYNLSVCVSRSEVSLLQTAYRPRFFFNRLDHPMSFEWALTSFTFKVNIDRYVYCLYVNYFMVVCLRCFSVPFFFFCSLLPLWFDEFPWCCAWTPFSLLFIYL